MPRATHKTYSDMISAALKVKGVSSRQVILKYIVENYKIGTDTNKINNRLKEALSAGVKSGVLKLAKGSYASGTSNEKSTDHPKYSEMIAAAIVALKEKKGSSRRAILKYIMTHYNVGTDEVQVNRRLKAELRAGMRTGEIKQCTGTGSAGSFKIA